MAEEARRAADFRCLREKAIEHANNQPGAGLLVGASLARAEEWLNEDVLSTSAWQPSAIWARRYAGSVGSAEVDAEFSVVRDYIRFSSTEAKRAEREEKDREQRARIVEEYQREAEAAAERADQQTKLANVEREKGEVAQRLVDATSRAIRQKRLFRSSLLFALVACLSAGYAVYAGVRERDRANSAEATKLVIEAQALWFRIEFESGSLTSKGSDALLAVARSKNDLAAAFLELV